MYEQQIERGMAWLDANHPGWEQRVNVGWLDLSSCTSCVLGQLGGSYWLEVGAACGFEPVFNGRHNRDLDLGTRWAVDFGFATLNDYFDTLTAEWRAAIQRRREDALPDPRTASWWPEGVQETAASDQGRGSQS